MPNYLRIQLRQFVGLKGYEVIECGEDMNQAQKKGQLSMFYHGKRNQINETILIALTSLEN